MIRTLTIHNIALIEHISVEFHNGLTVLSGETGAGKSIIVDAVALILGGRADRDLIRTGCDRASVEAEFETEINIVAIVIDIPIFAAINGIIGFKNPE